MEVVDPISGKKSLNQLDSNTSHLGREGRPIAWILLRGTTDLLNISAYVCPSVLSHLHKCMYQHLRYSDGQWKVIGTSGCSSFAVF